MRTAPTYSFRVSQAKVPEMMRVSGSLEAEAGSFPFDLLVDKSSPTSGVTDALAAYQTLIDGFSAALQPYLDDLEPCWGEDGGRILQAWGYATGPSAWILSVQVKMPDGQVRTVTQGADSYENWPSVETIHAGIAALIGAFPASEPPSETPWVPEDEDDVAGPKTSMDNMVQALLESLDDVTGGYNSLAGPATGLLDHGTRLVSWHPDPPSTNDLLDFVP